MERSKNDKLRKLLMGRRARLKPERLAEKLVQIRNALGLSKRDVQAAWA